MELQAGGGSPGQEGLLQGRRGPRGRGWGGTPVAPSTVPVSVSLAPPVTITAITVIATISTNTDKALWLVKPCAKGISKAYLMQGSDRLEEAKRPSTCVKFYACTKCLLNHYRVLGWDLLGTRYKRNRQKSPTSGATC